MKRAKLTSCYPMMSCHHLRRAGAVAVHIDAIGNTATEQGPLALALCPACSDWLAAMEIRRYEGLFATPGSS